MTTSWPLGLCKFASLRTLMRKNAANDGVWWRQQCIVGTWWVAGRKLAFTCFAVSFVILLAWAASCSAFFSPKRDADACLNLVITIFSLTGTEAGCPLISNRTTTRWLDGFTCSHNQSVLGGLATWSASVSFLRKRVTVRFPKKSLCSTWNLCNYIHGRNLNILPSHSHRLFFFVFFHYSSWFFERKNKSIASFTMRDRAGLLATVLITINTRTEKSEKSKYWVCVHMSMYTVYTYNWIRFMSYSKLLGHKEAYEK